jgi:hypothetical protein
MARAGSGSRLLSDVQPAVARLHTSALPWAADREKGEVCDDRPQGGNRRVMPGLAIEREMLIEAPQEVVLRIITEPDQMSLWFADRGDERRMR